MEKYLFRSTKVTIAVVMSIRPVIYVLSIYAICAVSFVQFEINSFNGL